MAVVLLLEIGMGGPTGLAGNARAAPPSPDLWIGFLQTIDYLNPYRGINDPSYFLYGLLYDYPYAFDGKGTFIPNIVTSATPNALGTVWNFTVRSNVYWSDGSLLTPADVAFTWNYDSQNLASLWAYEPYFNQVIQCSAKPKPLHCGAEVTGTDQVTLYFKIPFVAGDDLFGPIVQQAQWASVDPSCAGGSAGCPGGAYYNNANPIGTGPFIADPNIYNEFLNALSPGGYIHVSRNPRYHAVGANVSGSGDIHIQNIYLRFFSDATSLAANLLSGNIQLAQFSPSTIGQVKNQANIIVQSGLQVIQEWNEIGISQYDHPGSKLNPARFDVNVRRAMAMATNKDYIIQQFYDGQGTRGDTLISPVTPQWWYDPTSVPGSNLTYNIQAANALLNATGYNSWTGGSFGNGYRRAATNVIVSYQSGYGQYQVADPPNVTKTISAGTVLTFNIATRPQGDFPEEYATAQYLQQEYARIGIQLILQPRPTEDILSGEVYTGTWEMYIWYWSADPDPNYMLSMESSWTLDDWNDNFWVNASYNHYYLAQLADFDHNQRIADVKAAQRINYEMAPYIIYVYPNGEWAMRDDLWTSWGDWNKDPYMQMNAFWGANPLFFNITCPTCSLPPQNQPPTSPVIHYNRYASWYTNRSLNLTATSSDPETFDTLNFTWDWGDGTTTYCPHDQTVANCAVSYSSSTGLWSANGTHAWTMPLNYTIHATVTDGFTPVTTQGPIYLNVTEAPPVVGWLAGVIRDTSNHPLGGAYVSTSPGGATSSTTGSDGAYNLTLAPGTYDATASAHFFSTSAPVQVTIAGSATTAHDFALVPMKGYITGTVTSSATNAAIQGAAVYVTSSGGQQTSGSTNAAGKFNISLEQGTYTVNVSANGFTTQSRTGVQVNSGVATDLTFALAPTSQPETLFTPLVIGAIVAVVVIVAAVLLAVFLMRRRKTKEEEEARIELPPKKE